MNLAHSSRGQAAGFALALLAIGALVAPAAAMAKTGSSDLSPRLAKLASPALRSASPDKQAKALGLSAAGPGSLIRRGARVLAYVRFDRGALAAVNQLEEAGARIVGVSGRYQTVTVAAEPEMLLEVAAVPGVEGVVPVLSPLTAATCPSGAIVSEGDGQLNAAEARTKSPNPDGSGVTVGILSDSFDQATEAADGSGAPIATKATDDAISADLPGVGNTCGQLTPVAVLKNETNASEATDEGRAMTQIVHDLAPGASLSFASAFNGEFSFAENIDLLQKAGADVIADDVVYFEEPFFQDGPIAVAARKAVEAGSTYFSAAGNDNLIDAGHDIASWETPEFRDAGSCPPAIAGKPGFNGSHCLDFNPGSEVDKTFGIAVEPESELTIDLQWDVPWFGVNTDLDAFLLDSTGGVIAESHEDNVNTSEVPVEVVDWINESGSTRIVQLAVNRFAGVSPAPAVKFAMLENGGGVESTEYPQSSGEDVVGPTIFGHSGSAAAVSVGAVRFSTKSAPESYSSRGPVRHDFGPVESAEAAAPIGPEKLSKPDLVATDCGRTTFFAVFGTISGVNGWHFCGTSAAAPHAAAVAALMLDAKPSATPEKIRLALTGSAVPVGAFGPCAVGAGLVEAVGAVEKAVAGTGAAGPTCEPPESEVEPDEAQAPGSWGTEVPPPPPPPSGNTTPSTESPAEEIPPRLVLRTFIRQHPERVIRTRQRRAKAIFVFGSNEPDVSFVCRLDGGLFKPCPTRLVRRFPLGWHVLSVAARDASGNGDRTPASYHFKVKRVG